METKSKCELENESEWAASRFTSKSEANHFSRGVELKKREKKTNEPKLSRRWTEFFLLLLSSLYSFSFILLLHLKPKKNYK